MSNIRAVVLRENDGRTTIVEFPANVGVIDRKDPDMDYMTDEEVISQMIYQHMHVKPVSVEVYEALDDRTRYMAVMA